MKSKCIFFLSMSLIGINTLYSSQQTRMVESQTDLQEPYKTLYADFMQRLADSGNREEFKALSDPNNISFIKKILDPQENFYTKLMDFNTFTMSAEYTKNKVALNFLYKCYAVDTESGKKTTSVVQSFFDEMKKKNGDIATTKSTLRVLRGAQIEYLIERGNLTDAQVVRINSLLNEGAVLKTITDPIVTAIIASRTNGNNLRQFMSNFNSIQKLLKDPTFFKKFPQTWALLAKQSIDTITISTKSAATISAIEATERGELLVMVADVFNSSIPKRSRVSRLGSWFKEYCSISKILLKARTAKMSPRERYEEATKMAESLSSSKVSQEDICRSIGIILQNLSANEHPAGQPEALLDALSRNRNVNMTTVIDEIVRRVPDISIGRNFSIISLRTLFMQRLSDFKAPTPKDTISITGADEVTTFDPTNAPSTLSSKPQRTSPKVTPSQQSPRTKSGDTGRRTKQNTQEQIAERKRLEELAREERQGSQPVDTTEVEEERHG